MTRIRPTFYNLNIDAGAMWARRVIDRMVARETAPRPFRPRSETMSERDAERSYRDNAAHSRCAT